MDILLFTIFVCLYCKVHTHQNGLKPSSSLCISIGWRGPRHDKLLSFAFTLVAHVVCIATALDAKTVYLLPLSLIRSPLRGFACTLCKPSRQPFLTDPQPAVSANTDAVSGKILGLCELAAEKDKCLFWDFKGPTAGPYCQRYWKSPIIENWFVNILRNNKVARIDDGAAKNSS